MNLAPDPLAYSFHACVDVGGSVGVVLCSMHTMVSSHWRQRHNQVTFRGIDGMLGYTAQLQVDNSVTW